MSQGSRQTTRRSLICKAALALAPKRAAPLAADPSLSRRARGRDRRTREAFAEQHASEREDDGAKTVQTSIAPGSPPPHARAPRAGFGPRSPAARGSRGTLFARALGQHGDDLRPHALRTRRPPSPRSGRRGGRVVDPPPDRGPSTQGSRRRSPQGPPQSGPDRAPANADGPGDAATSASGASRSPTEATAPTEIDNARAASRACASTGEARINSRSERPNSVRVKSAIDWPMIQGRTSATPLGENRGDPRGAIGAVFNGDEPAGDRVGRDVERHEQESDQSAQSPQRQPAEHRSEAARAQAQIVQDETRKGGKGPSTAESRGAPGRGGQIEEHRLERRAAGADAGAQLIERPLGDHPPMRDDADAVREPLGDLENMGGHDDRRARPHAICRGCPSPAAPRRRRGRSAARRASGAAAHG